MTTDGVSLFVWDTVSASLLRIGTGLHGTVQGEVLSALSATTIAEGVCGLSGTGSPDSGPTSVSLAYCRGKLFLSARGKGARSGLRAMGLAPHQLAVFSCGVPSSGKQLALEAVVDVDLKSAFAVAVPDDDGAMKAASKADDAAITYTFECGTNEVADVRAIRGHELFVVSATYGDVDVTARVRELVMISRAAGRGDVLHIPRVTADALASGDAANDVSAAAEARLVVQCIGVVAGAADTNSGDAAVPRLELLDGAQDALRPGARVLHPALVSDGASLFFVGIETPKVGAVAADPPADPTATVFSFARDVKLSCHYFDSDAEFGAGNVTAVVQACFDDFFASGQDAGTFVAGNDLFTDTEVNVAKTLFLSVKVFDGPAHTLLFPENTVVAMADVLDAVSKAAAGAAGAGIDADAGKGLLVLYRCDVETSEALPAVVGVVRAASLGALDDADCASLRFAPGSLLDTSFVCNGCQLVVQQARRVIEDKDVELTAFRFTLPAQVGAAAANEEGLVAPIHCKPQVRKFEMGASGQPTGFCYDRRNNFVWGWDAKKSAAVRWRNEGLVAPLAMPDVGGADAVASSSAALRLAALEQVVPCGTGGGSSDPARQAAVILATLSLLSEPFRRTQPRNAPAAEADMANEVELTSTGADSQTKCCIKVRGIDVGPDPGLQSADLTGVYKVAVFAEDDFTLADLRHTVPYWLYPNALRDVLDGVPEGSLVLLACLHGCLQSQSKEYIEFPLSELRAIGVAHGDSVKITKTGALAIIGRKGGASGSAVVAVAGQNADAVLRRKLPPPKLPLRVECEARTLGALIRHVIAAQEAAAGKRGGAAAPYEQANLISLLQMLSVNLTQLFKGASLAEAVAAVLPDDRVALKATLLHVVSGEGGAGGGGAVAEAALQVFDAAFQLLYATPAERVELLRAFVDRHAAGTLSVQGALVLDLVLQRLAEPGMLAETLGQGGEGGAPQAASASASSQVDAFLALFDPLLGVFRRDMERELAATGNSTTASAASGQVSLGESAVRLMAAALKIVLSAAAQEVVEAGERASEAAPAHRTARGDGAASAPALVAMVSKVASACEDIALAGMAALRRRPEAWGAGVEDALKGSPLGELLPLCVFAADALLKEYDTHVASQGGGAHVHALFQGLVRCQAALADLAALVPQEADATTDHNPPPGPSVVEEVFESPHPYLSNMDTKTALNIAGASRVEIFFDPASRTEYTYDYLQLLNANGDSIINGLLYSGRDGNQNWPGCDGREPLVLEGEALAGLDGVLTASFHSDGGSEDWGYKFTVVAHMPPVDSAAALTWLPALRRQTLVCLLGLARAGLGCTPLHPELEQGVAGAWIEDALLAPDADHIPTLPGPGTGTADEIDRMLAELTDRAAGTLGAALAAAMKASRKIPEDQGTVEAVNRAVYSTCAAIIHKNQLGAVALAVAKGAPAAGSDALVKAWRAGQKIRQYFLVGDLIKAGVAKADGVMPAQALGKKRSVYAGAEDAVIEAAAEAVVARARLVVQSLNPTPRGAEGGGTGEGPRELVRSGSQGSEATGAKKLWGMLAKSASLSTRTADAPPPAPVRSASEAVPGPAGTLTRQASDPLSDRPRSTGLLSFASLVTETVATDRLKNMIRHRRKAAERLQRGGSQSTTERVLSFVQSDVDAEALQRASVLRTQRATERALGFERLAVVLESAGARASDDIRAVSATLAAAAFADMLAACRVGHEDGAARAHFLGGVEGAAAPAVDALAARFYRCLDAAVCLLSTCLDELQAGVTGRAQRQWTGAALALLHACALDYDSADLQSLDASGLLIALERVLAVFRDRAAAAGGEEVEHVLETAKGLVDLLVSRTVGIKAEVSRSPRTLATSDKLSGVLALEPKTFSRKLAALLVHGIERSSAALQALQAAAAAADAPESSQTTLISDVRLVGVDVPGLSAPHVDLTLRHSVSLWIKRPAAAAVDGRVWNASDSVLSKAALERVFPVGASVVLRRRAVAEGDQIDAEADAEAEPLAPLELGTVAAVHADSVTVKWAAGTTPYPVTLVPAAGGVALECDVAPADPAMEGHLYSKGAPGLLPSGEAREALPHWCVFGLRLLADATLCAFASCGAGEAMIATRSRQNVPPDTWTLVTVVQDGRRTALYVDGALDASTTMPASMTYAGGDNPVAPVVVESKHPYANSSFTKRLVRVPGAVSLKVTFDAQTSTEFNCDYVRFLKEIKSTGDNTDDMWGATYSGGYGGTQKCFPGVDGEPPLVIPADSVVVHFVSDAGTNDWGYKITISPELPADPAAEEARMGALLKNFHPFFVGQLPFYAGTPPLARYTAASASCLVGRTHVYRRELSPQDVSALMERERPLFRDPSAASRLADVTAPALAASRLESLSTSALLLRGLRSLEGGLEDAVSRQLTGVGVLASLFSLLRRGNALEQCAALRLCALVLPRCEVAAVEHHAAASGLLPTNASFGQWLLQSIGAGAAPAAAEAGECGDVRAAVVGEKARLLRALATAGGPWGRAVGVLVVGVARRAPVTVAALSAAAQRESAAESVSGPAAAIAAATLGAFREDVNELLGGLAFCGGGALEGLHAGVPAWYASGPDVIPEECIVLGPTAVPIVDPKDKAAAAVWDGLFAHGDAVKVAHGDAVKVALLAHPGKVVVVPRNALTPAANGEAAGMTGALTRFLQEQVGSDALYTPYSAHRLTPTL